MRLEPVTVQVPALAASAARKLKSRGRNPGGSRQLQNLAGDREIEWSWIAGRMPNGPGRALDFGTGGSLLPLVAAQKGYDVLAIDLLPIQWSYSCPSIAFQQGDLRMLDVAAHSFDLVINCSTIEHVGLAGRYDVIQGDANGDLAAMERLRELLTPEGSMLLTIPVGRDATFHPNCRVYGMGRLPKLLFGFEVVAEEYWVKSDENRWEQAESGQALQEQTHVNSNNPLLNYYALGCFVLRPVIDA